MTGLTENTVENAATSTVKNIGSASAPHVQVVIIGSGFSGLGAAVRLNQEGFTDFVILERAQEVGGTWRDNTYPGAACDTHSNLYSFSFAPNPNWSRVYAQQPEILAYLQGVAKQFGLEANLRFGHELQGAEWDNAEARWQLHTSAGDYTADFIISGHGPLVEPKWPEVPGFEKFTGEKFHSSRWNPQVDLKGKRVAVIGTGASAIQFVPAIAPEVEQMFVFQRTAPWIVPRPDRPHSQRELALFRHLPLTQRAVRQAIFARSEVNALIFTNPRMEKFASSVARAHLEHQVQDPALRRKLTPNYRMGCKRILVSNDFYPALLRPNVELVTGAISEIRPHSVVTANGQEYEVDVLICGTGFVATPPAVARVFRGKDGRTLAEHWEGSPEAYLGTTVSGFPNLFLMVGPNTATGHTSIVYMIEAQLHYILSSLKFTRANHVLAIDVKEDAQHTYNQELQASLNGAVWTEGGCTSFYLDKTGKNTVLWPGFVTRFRRRLARFDVQNYHLRFSPVRLSGAPSGTE